MIARIATRFRGEAITARLLRNLKWLFSPWIAISLLGMALLRMALLWVGLAAHKKVDRLGRIVRSTALGFAVLLGLALIQVIWKVEPIEISAFGAPVLDVYLLVLTEGGAVSLFGLVSLLLTGVFVAVQAVCADRSRRVGALTLTVLLIFALLLNMFPTFYALFRNVPVILAIALSASRLMEFPETPNQDKRTISLGEEPFWRMER